MTDEQIIKALEYCCGNIKSDEECSEDMCYQVSLPEGRNGDIRWCRQWLIKDALDLINRQKAEIESYEKERGRSLNCVFGPLVQNTVKAAKKAAIKEFAERLKNKIWYSDWCNLERTITPEIITTVVKEMTEVQE